MRGGAGKARREAHASITVLQRRSTLSASSAVRPAAQASSHQQATSSRFQGTRQASTRMTQMALMHSTATDECTLHVPQSPHLEAAQHLLKRQSLPAVPAPQGLTGTRLCQKAAPRHACRRIPLLLVPDKQCP